MVKTLRQIALISLTSWTACSSLPGPGPVILPPDPLPPSPEVRALSDEAAALLENSPELFGYVKELAAEAVAWKVFALRFKIWRAEARLIAGEIDQAERDRIVLPVLAGLAELADE